MLIEFDVPTRTRPATTPRSCCTRSTPTSSSWNARAACARRISPARVRNAGVTPVAAATPALRPACAADADELASIWSHEARATLTTTDTQVRDAAAQRAWLATHSALYPVVVAVADDEIAGYAALTPYR